MGNLRRGLATGLLLASVLAITGCDARALRVVITDFDQSQVEGVEIWRVDPAGDGSASAFKLPHLPYAWGVQVVDALGLMVFTDGEDILALPLTLALESN